MRNKEQEGRSQSVAVQVDFMGKIEMMEGDDVEAPGRDLQGHERCCNEGTRIKHPCSLHYSAFFVKEPGTEKMRKLSASNIAKSYLV